MPRPDVSNVTQEDVQALFDKDGDLREPSDAEDDSSDDEAQGDEDTEGEDESESEEGDEAEDSEESDEEESEEDEAEEEDEEAEAELDWDEVDEEYKKEHETVTAERDKLRKDYGKLHSKYTKEIQALREENGGSLEELRAQADVAQQWNSILEQHPDIKDLIEREIAKKQDPDGDVPDYLREDPLFQRMQQHNQRLEQRLAKFEESVKPVKNWQAQQQEQVNRQKLDGLLGEAEAKFKSMFGNAWTEDEKTEVLKYMVENRFYGNGKIPVMEVFGDRYEKALKARQNTTLKAKAKKFGTRNKGVNAGRAARGSKPAENAEEAIAMALAEQGYGQ